MRVGYGPPRAWSVAARSYSEHAQPTNDILRSGRGSATLPHRIVSGARVPAFAGRQDPGSGGHRGNQGEVAVIGTGWGGGIPAGARPGPAPGGTVRTLPSPPAP